MAACLRKTARELLDHAPLAAGTERQNHMRALATGDAYETSQAHPLKQDPILRATAITSLQLPSLDARWQRSCIALALISSVIVASRLAMLCRSSLGRERAPAAGRLN